MKKNNLPAELAGRPDPVPKRSDQAAYASLTIAAVLWGGSVIAQKWGVSFFSPLRLALFRGIGATLCLLPLWLGSKAHRGAFRAGDLPDFFLLAFLAMIGNQLFNYYGLRTIPASEAGMIMGLTPVLTVLLSSFFFKEPLTRRKTGGSLLSFAGVLLVVAKPVGGTAASSWRGDLFVGIGVCCWVLYTLFSRKVLKRHSSLTLSLATISIGTALLAPFALMEKGAFFEWEKVPFSAWIALAYLILFASALAFVVWNIGLQAVGPERASVFSNLIPVTALLLGMFLLAEQISARQVAGMVLILTSVWLVNRP
jgi:drug/metabolite transporter (DMT)-like permease